MKTSRHARASSQDARVISNGWTIVRELGLAAYVRGVEAVINGRTFAFPEAVTAPSRVLRVGQRAVVHGTRTGDGVTAVQVKLAPPPR
jgi:hypothetical protein